jgi:hypothetical protein
MELIGIGPGGEFRDEVELAKQRRHHLAGIIALAELIELPEKSGEGLFDLGDGDFGVVLAVTFETGVMFQELLAEEIREARTGRRVDGTRSPQSIGRSQVTLQVHLRVGLSPSVEAGSVAVNDLWGNR